ncbi:MAG: envelope stress response membrane protein PspB [Sphingobium sp.]
MGEDFMVIPILAILFIALPWVILHYVTKWKTAATLTGEDEALLDQLHDTARRLDERLATIERIIAAESHDLRPRAPVAREPGSHPLDRSN